jgi:hypothetical protein
MVNVSAVSLCREETNEIVREEGKATAEYFGGGCRKLFIRGFVS